MNDKYIEFSQAETKAMRLISKLRESREGSLLYSYMSYRIESEPLLGTKIVIKIDGKSYYTSKYRDLCEKMQFSMEELANVFNFPDTVYLDIPRFDFPFATIFAYYSNDDHTDSDIEYNIADNTSQTIDSLVEDILDLWRI